VGVSARTVYGAFRERLQAAPDEPFASCDSPWLTLAELDGRSDRLATGLRRLGVGRGDHLAWILPNRIETVEILIAVAKIGAVQIPLNYWLKGQFLEYQLSDCEAKFLITDGPGFEAASRLLANTGVVGVIHVDDAPPGGTAYRDLLADREQFEDLTQPGDLLTLMYTSGTTAAAKGCMLSTGYYVSVGQAYGLTSWAIPGDRLYTAFPMFHSSGQMVAFMSALVNGASIGIAPEFHATTFMKDAAAAGATALVGVGVMANMILAQPPSPDDAAYPFRLATWVPLPEDRQLEFEKRFATPVMAEGYGQSECVPVTNTDPYSSRDRNSSGRPSPLLEVRIFDEDDREVPAGDAGEIVVRPKMPNAMYSGYWRKPADTVSAWRNLWHHTGDFGRMDADGIVTFVDRKKDIVRRRGENVSSLAIENVIRQHPAVADVAICGLSAPMGDDDMKACLVLKSGASLTAEEFFEFIRGRVPYFAIPRYVELRVSLPANALGRIMKHVLRAEGVPDGTWDLESKGLVLRRGQRQAGQAVS
jgi:crotonobetaine/carnitine-CoA ligase